MAELWKTAREWFQKQSSRRNVSIPKLTQVLEVLQAQEEAKDHVYYDALRRISGSTPALRLTFSLPHNFQALKVVRELLEPLLRNDALRSRKPTNSGIDRNLTPSSLEDISEEVEDPSSHSTRRLRNYILTLGENLLKVSRSERFVVDSEDDVYYLWMGFVAAAVFFNLWTVILRIAFIETTSEESCFRFVFWLGDLLADGLYTCDIGIQLRTAYRDDQGIMVKDPMQLIKTYWKRRRFKIDLICILPLKSLSSLFCFVPCRFSFFRLPRLLKWHSVETFFLLSDYRTSKPNHLRAFKLILYLSVAMHWVACLYYAISEYEGLGINDWVYSESEAGNDHFTRKYVKSFYWSVLTLMTIGETPKPHTNLEYIFTGCMFLLGIFVFATVVGNVGDVISNMNAARTNFQGRMDSIKQFMEHHKVPETLQTRVKKWAHYTWSRTKALEEGASLEMLPERLRAEIAIHVHMETLRKVKIFKDCEQGLLCELVLKLRPQIFSPGDYICRCGEVGREMYIINNGKVEVVITNSTTGEEVAVASLSEGNYFGEISLLRLDGGRNRRSANVRSVGYSELLCLSQKDLMEALEEYPDAKTVLESQGRDRLQRTKSEGTLAVPRPDPGTEKLHEMESNFAREIKEMRDILEELKEDFKEVQGRRKIQDLEEECFSLKEQIGKQMVELHSLKRQQSCHNNFIPAEDERGNKSRDNAIAAEKLIQRLISAAAIASKTTKASQNSRRKLQKNTQRCQFTDEPLQERTLSAQNTETSQVSPALNCRQKETDSTNERLLEETLDPPDIYLENDIDGLCYLSGTCRRKPANSPLN